MHSRRSASSSLYFDGFLQSIQIASSGTAIAVAGQDAGCDTNRIDLYNMAEQVATAKSDKEYNTGLKLAEDADKDNEHAELQAMGSIVTTK